MLAAHLWSRRQVLSATCARFAVAIATPSALAAPAEQGSKAEPSAVAEWMNSWIETKGHGPPLSVSRFLDRIYFLNRDIWWEPENPSKHPYERITAPTGFVTDFASIPRVFWSILAPDENYAYSAVIHDWLYWNQALSRSQADEVLRLSMEELDVEPWKVKSIYEGVNVFGQTAWNENKRLKEIGEKRILKSYPTDARVTWAEWKAHPDAFAQ